MRFLFNLALVVAWVGSFGLSSANACSCGGGGGPCESYGKAAAVFVGTAIGYREQPRLSIEEARRKEDAAKQVDWNPRTFRFSVEQSYLGVEGSEIEVSTGRGGGDCGYEFKSGTRYLVYAYLYKERLTTNICTRTKPFVEATDDLAFLGNLSSAPRGSTIHGQVIVAIPPKGNPKPINPDVSVTLEGEATSQEMKLDKEGRYRLRSLRPGKYKLTVNLPDTLTTHSRDAEVTVADRGCAAVSFYVTENGRVSGKVLDVDGQPIPKIVVTLVDAAATDPTNSAKLEVTDAEGRYSFTGVSSGKYIIAINYQRFPDPNDSTNAYPRVFFPGVADQAHAEIVTIDSGEKITDREIRLPPRNPTSIVEGQVVWSDGSLVAGAFVAAKDVTYVDSNVAHGITVGQQGRFRINGYVGQKLIIDGRDDRGKGSGQVTITLDQPVHQVKIVLTPRTQRTQLD